MSLEAALTPAETGKVLQASLRLGLCRDGCALETISDRVDNKVREVVVLCSAHGLKSASFQVGR